QVHAVGRRTGHIVDIRLALHHAQRYVEGQRVAGTAAIAIRGDNGELAQPRQRPAQLRDTFRAVAVIVTDEYFHAADCRQSIGTVMKGAPIYFNASPGSSDRAR